MTFEFRGTINDILHQLYLISNDKEENIMNKTISEDIFISFSEENISGSFVS